MVEPAPPLQVEVAYALPQRQWVWKLELPAGATVEDAVRASGLREAWPDVDLDRLTLGVYAQRVMPGQRLKDGDRVEIYRPLQCDPMRARRLRAGRGQSR
ncbi:RnfH family protein [Frateuria aurantia]